MKVQPFGETGGIALIEGTVRRPLNANSPNIHRLLTHLEACGFDYSPRYLGMDDENREILTYLEGNVGHYGAEAHDWNDESLFETFRILRHYHDCTKDFVSEWTGTKRQVESDLVICHNDFAPYNIVYKQGQPVGIIDFDHAGPGPRQWDLAYAIYRFVPLSTISHKLAIPAIDPIARIKIALEGYGKLDTGNLYKMIIRRIEAIRRYTIDASTRNDENAQRIIRERHIESYDNDLELVSGKEKALSAVFDS